MARVTASEVREIIDVIAATDITSFITTANVHVTAVLGSETSLSADQLKQIELYLAAHFVAIDPRNRVTKQESTDGSQATFETGVPGQGLKATTFGQQAIALDTTGKLSAETTPFTFAVMP